VRAHEERIEALYLVNIIVKTVDQQILKQDPTTALLCHKGTLCLHRYLHLYDDQMRIPNMDARLYLAPPWTGCIMTPPHFDGHGTQMSLHRVLMGDGYNLVQVWHSLPLHLESKWRKVVRLPQTHEPQFLPHNIDGYPIDSDADVWDVKKEADLLQWGIRSTKATVGPGQVIVLPAGQAHVFKKIGKLIIPAASEELPVPLLGYAGDCTYVGPSKQSFLQNWLRIKHGHQLLRNHHSEVYSFYELSLLCLVRHGCEYPHRLPIDPVLREHFAAAAVPFSEFVEEERGSVDNFLLKVKCSLADLEVLNGENARAELICSRCNTCLANFHITLSKKLWCHQCWSNFTVQKQRGSSGKFRFMPVDKLEELLTTQLKLCNTIK